MLGFRCCSGRLQSGVKARTFQSYLALTKGRLVVEGLTGIWIRTAVQLSVN
jgi:hypothetical protein